MIEWIIGNKEWLFSGIGVTVLGVLIAWLFRGLKHSDTVEKPDDQRRKDLINQIKSIVNDILNFIESVKPVFPNLADDNPIIKNATDTLERDPYNIPALLIRGQAYYTNSMSVGGKGMREALADFRRAAEIDMNTADPHFGIGTVLYQLALIDLTRRDRYKIQKKGRLRINESTKRLEMTHPHFVLYVDKRNRILLEAALEEFQEGNRFRQSYNQAEGITSTFFSPGDVENRLRSIRRLLGYEPIIGPDNELVKTFANALTMIDPILYEDLFEIQKK